MTIYTPYSTPHLASRKHFQGLCGRNCTAALHVVKQHGTICCTGHASCSLLDQIRQQCHCDSDHRMACEASLVNSTSASMLSPGPLQTVIDYSMQCKLDCNACPTVCSIRFEGHQLYCTAVLYTATNAQLMPHIPSNVC